jgi:hypothetical protein
MKYLVAILTILSLNSVCFAKYVPQPGDEIIVKRNGKIIGKMTRAEYKVVKLGTSKDFTKEETTQLISSHVKKQKEKMSKWVPALVLGGGVGKDGLRANTNGFNYTVEERNRPNATAGLCAMKNNSGICGTISTNESIGVQFIIPLKFNN